MPTRIASSALVEHAVEVAARDMERGRQAEQNAGRDADHRHIGEHRIIDLEDDPVGLARVLHGRVDHRHTDDRDENAEDAAEKRQHHALEEQLPHDAQPCRAHRHAYCHLARAVRRPRQQQVGDVRARDEDEKRDGAEQRHEHDPRGAGHEPILEGKHADAAEILVRCWIRGGQPFGDSVHVRARGVDAHVIAQPPQRAQHARVAFFLLGVGLNGTHSSALFGNCIIAGITPTIVAGSPLRRIVCPSTFLSPP